MTESPTTYIQRPAEHNRQRLWLLAGLVFLYVVGGFLSQAAGVKSGQIPFVWPSFGLALTTVLLLGYAYSPVAALGTLCFSWLAPDPSVPFAVGHIVGDTVGAITSVHLLRRSTHFKSNFQTVPAVAIFVLIACLLGTSVTAAFQSVALTIQSSRFDDLFEVLMLWWVPSGMAALLLTPFFLVWARRPNVLWHGRSITEAVLCAGGLLSATLLSFRSWYVQGVGDYALAYMPVPFLVWGSLRFGQRGATTGTLLIAAVALSETLQQRGPFVLPGHHQTLVLVGSYICVLAILNLLLAAAATEKEMALQALIISERRYRGIVEDQTEMVWRFKLDGTLTFVNNAYCRFHEKSKEELLGSKFLSMLSEEDREIPLAFFQTLPPEEPFISYDLRLTLPSGQISWQQCTTRRIFDAEGNTLEFQSVAQDITRRKQTEEEIREAEHRQRVILDSMADAVLVLDGEGQIISINPSAEKLLETAAETAAGCPARQFFAEAGPFEESLHQARQTSRARIVECSIRSAKGTVIPIELSMSCATLRGKPLAIAVFRDIRQRKALEEQVRQSQKMEMLGRLAGGIAHDFNNIVQAVMGYANLLAMRTPATDPNLETVLEIERTADRASALTRQLLAFSRKQVLQPKVISTNAVITDISRMLKRLLRANIQFELRTNAVQDHVKADPGQLEQVIMNLAVNARDAMPDGGRLILETSEAPAGNGAVNPGGETGRSVIISVIDSGCGMTAEVKAKIFEPFFTTKEPGKGTGLGLSIVYGIIKQSGGEIVVESEVGQGTRFNIVLPQVEAPLDESSALSKGPALPQKGKGKVLLVEDEELIRALLAETLGSSGYEVLEADDGEVGLDLARKHEIDLLISDLTMPRMSGRVLAEKLREFSPNLRILFISGLSEEEAAGGMTAEGIQFLQKPFRGNVLLEKVGQMLRN